MNDNGHWQFEGNIPDGSIGFIYLITNKSNNKKYIGRKLIIFKTCKKALKGNKNKRRGTTESDWKTYCGSCVSLQEDISKLGKDNFKFEIIQWCDSKLTLNYAEVKHIIDSNAIFDKEYYNKYVGCRLVNRAK